MVEAPDSFIQKLSSTFLQPILQELKKPKNTFGIYRQPFNQFTNLVYPLHNFLWIFSSLD